MRRLRRALIAFVGSPDHCLSTSVCHCGRQNKRRGIQQRKMLADYVRDLDVLLATLALAKYFKTVNRKSRRIRQNREIR
jgi:hypothetical protein